MKMASFRQMTNEGVLKRADAEKIQHSDLHFEPGFNLPGRTEQDDEDDESLYQHICAGGYIPPLEVRPRDDGGVWVVEGHRRTKQIGRAIAAGMFPVDTKDGKFWVKVVQFPGNDIIKRTARLLTSNTSKKATDLQEAEVYRRLRGFDLTTTDIARECNVKRPRVEQLLAFIDADRDVQNAVKAGDISRTLAVAITKDHGEAAGAVIAAEVTKARAAGKKRVTASTMRPWAPPIKFSAPIVSNAKRLLNSMPADILAKASNAASMDDEDQTVSVTLSSKALFLFVQTVETVEALRVEAESKQREKVAMASQKTIEGVPC
jgi:ParB family chromosome partitioning protein